MNDAPETSGLFALPDVEGIPMFRFFEITTTEGPMAVNPNSVVMVTSDKSRLGQALLLLAAGGSTIPVPATQSRAEVLRRIHKALSTGMPALDDAEPV